MPVSGPVGDAFARRLRLLSAARDPVKVRADQRKNIAGHMAADQTVHVSVALIPREATTDVKIGGYRVARRTQLFLCTYLIHHDARLFPDPERFDPNRWTEDFTRQLPKLAYLPFGGGQRICIGNTFAMLELTIATAAVARRVRFELTNAVPEPPRVSFMLRPRGGVRLRITKLRPRVPGAQMKTEATQEMVRQ